MCKQIQSISAMTAMTLLATPAFADMTTGERVNALIDNLRATGERLLELPLFMLLGAVGVIAAILAVLILQLKRRPGKVKTVRVLLGVEICLVVFVGAFLLDRKITQLQDEVRALRSQSSSDAIALLNAAGIPPSAGTPATAPALATSAQSTPATSTIAPPLASPLLPTTAAATPVNALRVAEKRQSFLFDSDAAVRALTPRFAGITLKPTIYDGATDVVQIHASNPLVQAYLAVIDLKYPGLEIKLGGNLNTKTLTSAFARENDCTLAINGEAGVSPASWSGLGEWRGNLVQLGKVLSREAVTIPRPFLAFDRGNHADFTSITTKDRALVPERFNLIWGRLDAVVKGVVQTSDERNRQPRTAMGINEQGTRLYLLVVDGRQPRYSMGFTRAEVGYCLKAIGASDGMLCDEGGSSCMYLKKLAEPGRGAGAGAKGATEGGGICNIPSDNQGQERPTFTHFGIALHAVEQAQAGAETGKQKL